MVEAGDRDAADIVVVQSSAEKKSEHSYIITALLNLLYKFMFQNVVLAPLCSIFLDPPPFLFIPSLLVASH